MSYDLLKFCFYKTIQLYWGVVVGLGAGSVLSSFVQAQELNQSSRSCITCHEGIESMHSSVTDEDIEVTCVGCHGGNGQVFEKEKSHVQPHLKSVFTSSANPQNSYTVFNKESPEFIRFINPGDFRISEESCGSSSCHPNIHSRMLTSIMAHSAMIPQAGLYNNGIHDSKIAVFGEAYMRDGTPAALVTPDSLGTINDYGSSGLVKKLEPLPAFEMIPATDPFRLLERGNNAAGTRGAGTDFKIAGGGIVLHKTRLNDPTLWFLGANQTGGDYRSSGCTACHVTYANDREEANNNPAVNTFYLEGGKDGHSASKDKRIPRNEPGHPITHQMTLSVPISQCLTCHHHQGNGALGNYVGAMWWDQESDAANILEPGTRRDKFTSDTKRASLYDNNGRNSQVQIADWHGHGWNFRKVYKRDRKGNLLDADDNKIPFDDPERFQKGVHLQDIHMERGMHCIDCHTQQDIHGDGRLWGTMINPIEIRCEDCHGSITERASLITSGLNGGTPLEAIGRTPFGDRQFQWNRRSGKLIQRSKIHPDKTWEVPQLVDAVDPQHERYNSKAARAKTMLRDGRSWGETAVNPERLAHGMAKMECYSCHSAWNTNCYGCHLSAEVNRKARSLHFEGSTTRAYVDYNPMVLRSDAFVLGINGTAKGNKFSPMRSASAVIVTARDRKRNVVVHQQPTVSAAGYSGFAITPNPPHTVRTRETKTCTDCHLSTTKNNNAWMAATLGMGTNSVNFIGEYAYVALDTKGIQAVKVTEGLEPQPVIGSNFHRLLNPESYRQFVQNNRQYKTVHSAGSKRARSIATRGEWIFIADGPGGFAVYDRSQVANKSAAQRLIATQNSPLGQRTRVSMRDATGVALPTTVPMNLDRPQLAQNLELPIAELFRYAYITDRYEGLVVVDVNTLHDGNPQNNYLERAVTYNPDHKLDGVIKIKIAGNYAYMISTSSGLHIVDISKPRQPRWVANVGPPYIIAGRSVAIQLHYAFVVDSEGFKVIDISEPRQPVPVTIAAVPLTDARDVYPLRTYVYVAAGRDGMAIIDIEKPENPQLVEMFDANGQMNDVTSITTGTVNASTFAFVADGHNGLRIVRLIEPPEVEGHLGFSPQPKPKLIGSYKTRGPAVAIADGMMRDRATDEDGNQIGVGGRLGSHPLHKEDIDKLLRRNGRIFRIVDTR